ncbi:MAG: cytochrome P450 [Nocardioides marinisabuli]|uniref:cytochrome P450 n=1 Tax=Nocardioides marinisabuli TaxID=419476 RepID=UPI003218F7FD
MTSVLERGTEQADGRLGAVLRAVGRPQPVALGRHGPWVVTTLEHARSVLTDPGAFDFPVDVSRRSLPRGQERDRDAGFVPLPRARTAVAADVLVDELRAAVRSRAGAEHDAMRLLRRPVARATAAAVLDGVADPERDAVADAVLAWIDALAPVIAALRPPGRWSRVRRHEDAARTRLESLLQALDDPEPARTATMLAAGTQVPIAAGAWLLVALAERPALQHRLGTGDLEPSSVVWEVLRLTPPTWVTARVARRAVVLGGERVPEGGVVLVSPLLLGRLAELVPAHEQEAGDTRALFAPDRWQDPHARPGAWLPFGAGPHACPGRSVGLAQLVALTTWAGGVHLELAAPVHLDQSRGIFPRPARLAVTARDEVEG